MNKQAQEALEYFKGQQIAWSRNKKGVHYDAAVEALQAQIDAPEPVTSGPPDEISLESVTAFWDKYIQMEMRDPCGMNEHAKCALAFLIFMREKDEAMKVLAESLYQILDDLSGGKIVFPGHGVCEEAWDDAVRALDHPAVVKIMGDDWRT